MLPSRTCLRRMELYGVAMCGSATKILFPDARSLGFSATSPNSQPTSRNNTMVVRSCCLHLNDGGEQHPRGSLLHIGSWDRSTTVVRRTNLWLTPRMTQQMHLAPVRPSHGYLTGTLRVTASPRTFRFVPSKRNQRHRQHSAPRL